MSTGRELKPPEHALIAFLLASKGDLRPIPEVAEDMDDGGMGSLLFPGSRDRIYGGTLAEAEFRDEDGTPVLVSLNLDSSGELFELDVWKVDFSPLIRIPPIEQVKLRE